MVLALKSSWMRVWSAYGFFLAAAWFSMPPHLFAESNELQAANEILAIGTGEIVKGNFAAAKDEAVSQALMKGVEEYLFRRLGRTGAVDYFQRLVEEVIPGAKTVIGNFNILRGEQFGNKYKVLVLLTINEKVMEERLKAFGLTERRGPHLMVLFLVSEKRPEAVSYWWKDPEVPSALTYTELALHRSFEERGLRPVNRTLSPPGSNISESMRSLDLSDPDLFKWGRLFGADVVISGHAQVSRENEVSLSLRALDVKRQIHVCPDVPAQGVEQKGADEGGLMEGLNRLAGTVTDKLAPCIIQEMGSGSAQTGRLEITLQGLKNYGESRVFMDFLASEVSGVKSVRQTRVRRDSVSMALEFSGSRDELLKKLLTHGRLPFPLKVTEMEGEKLVLTAH